MADQRYRVIDRLEAGGMAEVFRAEAISVQGFKKQVAIKRVLPHLSQNRNFIAMFLDEARLGARLNHANIVTVFDIGAADNTYFIVMEYIDGGNLKSVMEAIRKEGRPFPLKEALYICMEACRGLSYAHETTDDDGQSIGIVHRDVSPPNIMLSRRGEVKLTDFGLAKATTQLEKTDPGVVKGKFSYLSPEAAVGRPVDARADVFALGVVLWEMLASKRLFLGESDYHTVKMVQRAEVPSLVGLHQDADEEFNAVLQQALARDPDQRFQSAREFGDALAGYLFGHRLKVTSYDIANLVKRTLSEEPKAKQTNQSIIDRLIQEELSAFQSIDEMSDPLRIGSAPLDLGEIDGSQPLMDVGFENPQDWFAEDHNISTKSNSEGSQPLVLGQRGWHESGSDAGVRGIADLLEDQTGPANAPAARSPM
ncbi:MAG: serine/threonine protein kinase, partial [Myxococcales bacterium]|nr:serine/threonine protein kinase [Myxococcales bacterium]